MPPPEDTSQPRLVAGCRWGPEQKPGTERALVILFPEGAIKLQGTGRQVSRTLRRPAHLRPDHPRIASSVHRRGPNEIRTDISHFLEQLRHKRIVDY